MSRFLLDVNVVIALLDRGHVFHEAAHAWYGEIEVALTCPLVHHGVVRVISRPTYPNSVGTVGVALEYLRRLLADPRHEVIADDRSLVEPGVVQNAALLSASHVTDLHLLALAVRHRAQLATFDRRIPAAAIAGGPSALTVIPTT